LLALLPGWLLQQKGVSWVLVRVLRPASERASGVVTKTSTNNNSNKGGGTNTNKGLKKRKRKKREHPFRALLYQFSYIFL
jgi:hypothetical protein